MLLSSFLMAAAPMIAALLETNATPVPRGLGIATLQFFQSTSSGTAACGASPVFIADPNIPNFCNNVPERDVGQGDYFAVNVTSLDPGCSVQLFDEECDTDDSTLAPTIIRAGVCAKFGTHVRSFQVLCPE